VAPLRCAFFSLCLILAALPGAAQDLRLSPEGSRDLAHSLQLRRQPEAALDITAVLLDRDPADVGALIIRSRALRDLGRYDEAAEASRAAWDAAEEDRARYAAAIATAEAQSSGGNRSGAQLWLRRAVDVAPDDRARARAIRDFRYVRSQNPWSARFRFAVTPSDNINGGPTTNTFVIGGLEFVNPSAVPLAGQRLSMDAGFGHSQTTDAGADVDLALDVSLDLHRLSDSAKAAVPTARASDYDQTSVEFGVAVTPAMEQGQSRLTYRASAGRNWLGGQSLDRFLELGASVSFPMTEGRALGLDLSARKSDRSDESLRSSETLTFGLRHARRLESGDRLSLFGELERQFSESTAIAHDGVLLGLGYGWSEPIAGGALSLSLALGLEQYDSALFSSEPRRDRRGSLSLSYLASGLARYGFAPTVTLSLERNRSNVSLFDTRTVSLRLGFASEF
jgi:hypothetical protein